MNEALSNKPNIDPRPILGKLMSGEIVVPRSDVQVDLEPALLEKALSYINGRGRNFIEDEVYMGEHIGFSACVETNDEDEIIYAYRPDKPGPTRFVMNREAVPTENVTIILKYLERERTMMLMAAYAGDKAEPEIWDKHASENSQDFWGSHALIWGSVPIDGSKPITGE